MSFGYHETEREQALQLLCLDETRCLMPEQKRELIVDSTFAIVEVGVADTASLNGYDGFTRTGIWNDDGLESDWLAFSCGDDSPYLLAHGADGSAVHLAELERQPICLRWRWTEQRQSFLSKNYDHHLWALGTARSSQSLRTL